MRTRLTVPAKDRENAAVQAALIIEDRATRGDHQRITGDPVRTQTLYRGIKGLYLWHVPVEDAKPSPAVSHTFANGVNCYDPNPIVWVNGEDCLHGEDGN